MSDGADPSSVWSRACLAAAIFATDPAGSGVLLRAAAGPVRDAWLAMLKALLPTDTSVRRVPLGIDDHRLLGGIDLPATLRAGRPVAASGLLAEAHGGVLVLAMAERLSSAAAARLAATLDGGEVRVERDGFAFRAPARFGVVALDEGEGWDERPPEALTDRLALHVDLSAVSWRDIVERPYEARRIEAARASLASVRAGEETVEALVWAATRIGATSFRAPLFALHAARAACALRGAEHVDEDDVATAARLVLGPRATQLPPDDLSSDLPDAAQPDEDEQAPPTQESGDGNALPPQDADPQSLNEIVLAAALAAIPSGLLDRKAADARLRGKTGRGGTEVNSVCAARGRPIGARQGQLREGRLAIVDTLRAAAPWQSLRRKAGGLDASSRVLVRPEDFRIIRFRARRETTAIFVVDASGSAAAQRLAEVKGAVELLLSECYTRRQSVALIAFRGKSADIVLSPTRSLTRAKRALAGLPGGGGTPLAAGLDAAVALAAAIRRKGASPLLVLMTDGRANIGRNGQSGRSQAFDDALNAAQGAQAAGVAAIAIDTSPRAQKRSEPPTWRIGRAMNAHYVELPDADAARVTQAVLDAADAA